MLKQSELLRMRRRNCDGVRRKGGKKEGRKESKRKERAWEEVRK